MLQKLYFQPKDHLPKELTSNDLLKAVAIITMIIDHAGYYLFPDELWMRLIGRMSFPLWLFLIGYAKSRDLSPALWVGAIICAVVELIVGGQVFALNILFTILLVRLTLDFTMRQMFDSPATIWIVPAILIGASVPTWHLFEYGSLALMVAMTGWLMRRETQNKTFKKVSTPFFMVTILSLMVVTTLAFGLNNAQSGVLAILLCLSFGALYFFKPQIYPQLTAKLPKVAVKAVQIMGRYSLEIYIIHVFLFLILAQWANPTNFRFMQWSWF